MVSKELEAIEISLLGPYLGQALFCLYIIFITILGGGAIIIPISQMG